MKSLLTLALAVLFCTQIAHSQLVVKTDKDTSYIKDGETALFNIAVTVPQDFDGTVFLTAGNNDILSYRGEITLSTLSINYPYKIVILTVKTKEGYIPKGTYTIGITANSATTKCYVNVTNSSHWRVYQLGVSGAPTFITQDNGGSYWCNKYYDGRIEPAGMFKIKQSSASDNWFRSQNRISGGFNIVTTMKIDTRNDKKYFGSPDGLARYNNNIYTLFNTSNSPIPDNFVTAIEVDNESSVWIGTNKGLARLIGNDWTRFDSSNSILGAEPITGIAVSANIVWVGTRNGLAKFDGTNWTRFTPQNSSMPAPFVWSMAVDVNGELWAGLGYKIDNVTFLGGPDSMIGLAKYDGTTWNLYDNTNSPMSQSHYVNSIAIDKQGNKWIATSANYYQKLITPVGLLKFDNLQWTAYNHVNSPLFSNDVGWVGLDNSDNIWFTGILSAKKFWGVFNERGLPPYLFAPPTGVEEQPEVTDGITIYPNPTNTSFTISGADNILSVKIMNSLGMEISRKSLVVSGTVEMDVADLASGLYFVQMRTATGMITKSIVVSR